MQVNSISGYTNYNRYANYNTQNPKEQQNNTPSFTGEGKKASAAMTATALALLTLSSCGKEPLCFNCPETSTSGWSTGWSSSTHTTDTVVQHDTDTIDRWRFVRPIPLDTIFKNLQNWDIPGTPGIDYGDSLQNRNIIHYEGVRDWEYDYREIGDINMSESSKNILVYDIELKDYLGQHIGYGKRVFRVPTSDFVLQKLDGTTVHNPRGIFMEEWTNENDVRGPIQECTPVARFFTQTNGDTLRVAKKANGIYEEKGTMSEGYLGSNTILLKNLIGQYATDDHILDFSINAVNDERLRDMYVQAMENQKKGHK